MRLTLTTALLLTLAATATAQRQKAEVAWKEGKMTIDYDPPTWRESFTEMMASEKTWRLGQNNPTRVTMTCGLMTGTGAIPAGEYGMAMKKNDQGKWDLVVYPGDGQFNQKASHWTIPVAGTKTSDTASEKLTLEFNAQHQLAVQFGPHVSSYSLKPIKMLDTVAAEFATMPTKVEVMAIPVSGKLSNVHVGSSSVEASGMKIAWNMALTIDGENATLAFENTRAKAIEGEKKQIAATIERVKGMLDGANEARKKRIEEFLGRQKDTMKDLDKEASMLERYKPAHSFTGKVSSRTEAASTLALKSERVEGGIVLTFGAGKKTASFTVKPREFRVRRQRR